MRNSESDGPERPLAVKTPAPVPLNQKPPRNNAPGRLVELDPGPPTQLTSLPKVLDHMTHPSARSPQSPTHSQTFPTMSNAPHFETHADREPVFEGFPVAEMLQSVDPSSTPESGVPAAARCHSWFVMSRFPESAHIPARPGTT